MKVLLVAIIGHIVFNNFISAELVQSGIKQDRCQTGVVCMGQCNPYSGDINCSNRNVVQGVRFSQPFTQTPQVLHVGFYHIDVGGPQGTHVRFAKEHMTPYGFNIRFVSWSDDITYNLCVEWLACP
ncbi:unnamed protein product [Rotaria socialis]|nr:unnamed protein product [Rotaria socialis]CAF3735340.1 unnamed protein product [Rotaria socialis]CAF4530944.1 unnamed protein product [Rotaria socialis]CAF4649849.1 unnamed protein product [Rotaria socialis]CAF4875267.1 unnamed protein product [Rotaria socialis]